MTEVISQNVNGNAMTEISVEEKFEAALNVIRNLPKDGPYKPSPEMMLKFYGYYKQATEGKCMKPKPWAWDVINKAKWDAWHSLGDMEKSEAMKCYVQSLLQIVEVMPVDENVQRLLQVVGNFYEIVEVEPTNQFKKFSKSKIVSSTPIRSQAVTMNGHTANNDEESLQDGEDSNGVTTNGHHQKETEEEYQGDGVGPGIPDDNHKIKEESLNGAAEKILNEEVNHMPSDSEDEFCDTAENVVPNEYNVVISDTKESPTNSYTMVNSDDNMGSGSSHKSDSLSNLDDSVEEENQGRITSDNLYSHSSEKETTKAKIQTRGGEYGARGSDSNNPASSRQNAGHSTQPGHSGDFRQVESTSRQRIGGSGGGNGGRGPGYSYSEVQDQIATTLIQLQQDMNSVLNRLTILEALTVGQQARRGRTSSGSSDSCPRSPTRRHRESSDPSWWPFSDLSPRTTLFILLWPFAVRWILMYLRRRRRV